MTIEIEAERKVLRSGNWELSAWSSSADEQPRIRDIDAAARLGFKRPRKIRELIERTWKEGERPYCRPTMGRQSTGNGASREYTVNEYWLTLPEVLKLCARSTTPPAEAILDEMIAVFLAWQRGQLPASPSALEVPVSAEVLRKLQAATGNGPMVPAQVASTVLHSWARGLDTTEPSFDAADKLAAISGHLCGMRYWVIEQFSREIEELAHKATLEAGLGILGKVPGSARRQLEHELQPHANALGISVGELAARLCRVWLDASRPNTSKELAALGGAAHEKPFRKR